MKTIASVCSSEKHRDARLRLPRWRSGPMLYSDTVGLDPLVERIAGFARELGQQ